MKYSPDFLVNNKEKFIITIMERETIVQKNIARAQQSLKRRYSEIYSEIGVERLLTDIQKNDWKTGEIVLTDKVSTTDMPESTDYRYFFGYKLEASDLGIRAFISISSNAQIMPSDMGATLNQLLMVSFNSDVGISDRISTRGVNMRDANLRIRGLLAQDKIVRTKEHKYPLD